MFEVIAILFVIMGIVSSVLQAAQKGKQTGKGFPPPVKTETHRIEIVEESNVLKAKKSIRKGVNKALTERMGETALVKEEVKPAALPIPAQSMIDTDVQHEISIDRRSVLNGVIFSVILSPPKCKGMDSIF